MSLKKNISVKNVSNKSSLISGGQKSNEDDQDNLDENFFCSWDIDPEGAETEEVATVENEEQANTDVSFSKIPFEVPRYEAEFTGYLTEKEFSMETGKHVVNDSLPRKFCFNCLGDHSLQDCTEKRNPQAIAKNRKNILGGRKGASVRYHLDVENIYSQFKPGEISGNLSKALGLHDGEAPEFIYRMRVLGYPPGWLKEAEVRRSQVLIIDGAGKSLDHPENEEGEIEVQAVKYQPDKLVSFPGFNVPFPREIVDQCRQLNFPPMLKHHSRESFLKFMNRNKATKYKRRKLKADDTPNSSGLVNPSAGDMDVDNSDLVQTKLEFNPPLPETPGRPPLPTSPSTSISDKEDGELSDKSEDSNDATAIESESSNQIVNPTQETPVSNSPSEETNQSIDSPSHSNSPAETRKPGPDSQTGSNKKRKQQHRSQSKGFTLGVFLPESITPHETLPDSTKWTVDVSDHILFDNLPDALGTWTKMKGLVSTVRNKMTDIHAEDD